MPSDSSQMISGIEKMNCALEPSPMTSNSAAQRHDRREAQDAYGDEDAFDDAGRQVAEGEDLVLALEDRE